MRDVPPSLATPLIPFEVSHSGAVGTRKIWLQPPITGRATRCCLFLDAELYIERVQAPAIAENLQRDGRLPPTLCCYLSSVDAAARHRDFTCNEDYSSFLVNDVIPWIERDQGHFEHYLGGLSLSGLAAAFTVLRYPNVFAGALCQSPSAWWNEEWLTSSIDGSSRGKYWISVGDQEVASDVRHPPTDLFQGTSQLDSVRRLVARLRTTQAIVRSHEYSGGHDPACWAAELPDALTWLLKD